MSAVMHVLFEIHIENVQYCISNIVLPLSTRVGGSSLRSSDFDEILCWSGFQAEEKVMQF